VAISPQLPEHSRELIERRHLTFEILSDRGNEVAAKFGLRFSLPDYLRRIYRTFPLDLETFNGDASWTLPMPARFVIDRQGGHPGGGVRSRLHHAAGAGRHARGAPPAAATVTVPRP